MNLIQSVEWAVIAPVVAVAVGSLTALLVDLLLPPASRAFPAARRGAVLGGLAVAAPALALALLLPLRAGDRATFCLTVDPAPCSYVADRFALTVQALVLLGALLAALISLPALTRPDDRPGAVPAGEYVFLLLASATGAALLPAARDLATLILALEVATLPVYALVALRRADRLAPEAALKFLLSSVTATAVTLLGVGFLYAAAGGLHLTVLADALPDADPALSGLVTVGAALALVGFALKVGAVPFHFWIPDTYGGAPPAIAGYLAVVGKTAGLAGLVLLTTVALPGEHAVWGPALALLAGLTMTLGNVAALRVDPAAPGSAVRLLAWSSVGQAGWLLVPLAAAGREIGAGDTGYAGAVSAAVGATLSYALMYAVVTLGAFAVVLSVRGGRIADHRGMAARRRPTALAMAFFLICLAGLPPGLIGLFTKVAVIRSAVDADLAVLAVVAAVNVVIALVYYLRWIAVLFRPVGEESAAGVPVAGAPATVAEPTPVGGGAVRPAGAADVPATGAPGEGVGPEDAPSDDTSGVLPAAARPVGALPLSVAVGLAAGIALVLSGWPQIILRLASGTFL
ncbi:NADH-quinone oxidoreductase subunit N [Streptomyces sp. ST2-7A]|uniref:NADH-quinone oxidoreductase subunit N n=1 Tax=Streptomyces sp. ST2-7A TaxID=2907214 RepID=UPI001F33C46E|nr:proton-conducting transporter membrane subunit [Streptomyces sp. ST2-7A]MCE7078862.1 NADH-quinone oxidoreductase subunit N [Streptomyces sp. ST2-7A]